MVRSGGVRQGEVGYGKVEIQGGLLSSSLYFINRLMPYMNYADNKNIF